MAPGYNLKSEYSIFDMAELNINRYGLVSLRGSDEVSETQNAKGNVRFNPNTMAYETDHQNERIFNLEKQLKESEEKKERNLQNIIGYFYTSRG